MAVNFEEMIQELLNRLFGSLSVRELQIVLYTVIPTIGLICFIGCAVTLAYVILQIAAKWKMFRAAGQGGWKVLIPFLNSYTMYKITWTKSIFWVVLILTVSGSLLSGIGTAIIGVGINTFVKDSSHILDFGQNIGQIVSKNTGALIAGSIVIGLGCLVSLAVWVIGIIAKFHISKAFNHGFGYFLGLVFFDEIFMLIIGFDSGLKHIGNAEERKTAKRGPGFTEAAPAKPEEIPMIHEVYSENTVVPVQPEETVQEAAAEVRQEAETVSGEADAVRQEVKEQAAEAADEVRDAVNEAADAVHEKPVEP